jgi:IclR family mhp operon transcriptional activator
MDEHRGLQRGLALLEDLARQGPAGLALLARRHALPKSTVKRALGALVASGLARRSLADDQYRANILLLGAQHRETRLELAAAPILRATLAADPWPSDVMVRDGLAMRTVENNRRAALPGLARSGIGERVAIHRTAVGHAYLAWCAPAECTRVLALLAAHGVAAAEIKRLEQALEATRQRGHAERPPGFRGGTERAPRRVDGLDAIALPIGRGAGILGAVNVMWPRRLDVDAGFVAAQKARLAALSAAIEAAMG